ncbi:MAG: branched-chain amino acid ABC transporter permease [Actinomycetes bacterium]
MSGDVALQALVSGVSVGLVYGLVGLGFTLVYRLTRVYAFAHGDVVLGAVFISVLAVLGSTPIARSPSVGASLGLALMMPLVGAGLSALVYVVAVRPYLGGLGAAPGEVVGWVAGGIAAGLAIRESLGLVFTQQGYVVPDPLHLSALTSTGVVTLPLHTVVPVHTFGVLAVGAVVAVLADLAVERGRIGLALRATSDDAEAAALLGVPIGRVVLIAFLLAGLLAGIAGLLQAPSPGQSVSVDAGVILGLKGAAAAFVGGIGSVRGALVGGVVVGVLEQYVVAWSHLGAAYVDVVPLALLVVLIAVRPEGRRFVKPVL